jgi:hypothetical protein
MITDKDNTRPPLVKPINSLNWANVTRAAIQRMA